MTNLLTILRIPDGDIVVTRKVPMTDETCDELRGIQANREELLSDQLGERVMLPLPTLLQQLIHEEYVRTQLP